MRPRPPVPEPYRCPCQPGPNAHHQHARPGRTTGLHFDARCRHSTLYDDTHGYAVKRQRIEAQRRDEAERQARARAARRRPIWRVTL